MASNVAHFPKTEPVFREVAHFGKSFLEGLLFGSEWKDLAREVNKRKEHLSPNIHPFINQMLARTARPTINQLSMLTGLFIQGMAREKLLALEQAGAPNGAEVVPIRK